MKEFKFKIATSILDNNYTVIVIEAETVEEARGMLMLILRHPYYDLLVDL